MSPDRTRIDVYHHYPITVTWVSIILALMVVVHILGGS